MKLSSDRESHRASKRPEHEPAELDVAGAKVRDGRCFDEERTRLGDSKAHDGDATTSKKRGEGPRRLSAHDDDV